MQNYDKQSRDGPNASDQTGKNIFKTNDKSSSNMKLSRTSLPHQSVAKLLITLAQQTQVEHFIM